VTTYRDVLRNSEFRGLVVAQVASEWGDNIARVALASLVLTRTDSFPIERLVRWGILALAAAGLLAYLQR